MNGQTQHTDPSISAEGRHQQMDTLNTPRTRTAGFVAYISHEICSPLTSLKMRLHLARKQPEKLEEHLRMMEMVTNRMVELVSDLLDMSRLEYDFNSLNKRRVALQDLITFTVELHRPEAEDKSIILTSEMPADSVFVTVDPNRIMQVLTNLTVNAIHYTPPRGQITLQLAAQGEHALIRVRDTGIGIPSESVKRIFEPFYRVPENSAKGTGLGLTITRDIIEAHGGTIAVESEVGRGSIFSVLL
jgi:two-component system, OmpR family, phosphate regulon sensor histidine kinase PhoR